MEFRTEEEILEEALDHAQQRNLISMDEDMVDRILEGYNTENQYVLDMSTHSYVLEPLEDKAKQIYENINLDTASGEALDRLGNLLGVFRSPSTTSIVEVDVELITTMESNFSIPEGTKLVLDEVASNSTIVSYSVIDDYVIPQGSTNVFVRAESDTLGQTSKLPAYAVIGLEGLADVKATNYTASTGGRDIEEDDDYRQRIKAWASKTVRGSKACLDDYLLHLDLLSDYRLIPQWDGVGSLKIVCDCLAADLPSIEEGVQENCMLYTDDPVVCVPVEEQQIENMDFTIWIRGGVPMNRTLDELSQIISGQVRVYVEGGTSRTGVTMKGLGIGGELDPSKLISFLHSEVPEVDNIRSNIQDVVLVDEMKKLKLQDIGVQFEWKDIT